MLDTWIVWGFGDRDAALFERRDLCVCVFSRSVNLRGVICTLVFLCVQEYLRLQLVTVDVNSGEMASGICGW